MIQEDLQFVAEALLSLCQQDRQQPFYTQTRQDQKRKLADAREPFYAHLSRAIGSDPLLEGECQAIFEAARLTERQNAVLNMRLDGFTFEEIGRRGGHTKQGAQSIFCQALKKISRAIRVYPYRGLSEVYRFEVHRGGSSGSFGTMAPRR